MHVKSKTFQLQYQLDLETVGPSRVASVDIWKLHQGRGWQKCKETGKPEGPATVAVETSGRWGFRLIPRSGVGLAERDPRPGDSPDIWVEVDDKAPQVKVTNVTVSQEADGGYLTVYWKADDTFLQPMPITILMKDPKGAEWSRIAVELPNTGSWRHRTDDLKLGERYEFSLKVTAVDEAGNLGEDQWREVVKVDLKIPRIKSIEVKPGGAAAGGGQEAYGARHTAFRRADGRWHAATAAGTRRFAGRRSDHRASSSFTAQCNRRRLRRSATVSRILDHSAHSVALPHFAVAPRSTLIRRRGMIA